MGFIRRVYKHDCCYHPCHLAPPTSSPLTKTANKMKKLGSYSLTFKFLCAALIQVEMELVSRLLSMEEQLAIFLCDWSQQLKQTCAGYIPAFWENYFKVCISYFPSWFIFVLLVHLSGKFITSPPSHCVSGHITSNPKFLLFLNNCLPHIVIARGFYCKMFLRLSEFKIPPHKFYVSDAGYGLDWGVLVPYRGTRCHLREQAAAGRFHQLLWSEYKLKQQYNILIEFFCVHNINIICNGLLDDLFSESNQTTHIVCAQDTKDTYNDQCLLSNQEREEFKSWQDGIAEDMWEKYVVTLEKKYGY
ncbi:uncharacterized protein VP01_24g9 [Puccinia sorghi]|uniref:DDE Tnp4 domain-containing protein n=1 Tax=Puccinia sorghi TaxID=27349 RepID=A0A0L6V5P9_9BASI|nr:uncharacterized protein VP01_24g9 [Puccinia sorghi]